MLRIILFLLPLLSFADDYYLIILTDAKGLRYTTEQQLIRSIAKHPRTGSKSGEIGHAWIYLKGENKVIEGGHSGELGQTQPRFFEGLMNLHEYGFPYPTQKKRYEPNPIKYFWVIQQDGFFQQGSGGHVPSFAAKFILNKEQYHRILQAIQSYPFNEYCLVKNQCTTFCLQLLKQIDIMIDALEVVDISPTITVYGSQIRLWEDPIYAKFPVFSPEKLEHGLKSLVKLGKAQDVSLWYKKKHKPHFCFSQLKKWFKSKLRP